MNKYVFKVTSRDQENTKEENIEIFSDKSLYDLAEKIVYKFKIDFGHCFGFFGDTMTDSYLNSEEKYELFTDLIDEGEDIEPTGALSVKKTKIKNVWKNKGDSKLFLFDYGDSLEWIVEMINIK